MRRLLRALSTTIPLAIESRLRDAAIALERAGSNIKTGLTLVEAVTADDLNSRLLAGVGDAETAHEIRVMALQLMEAGVTTDEVHGLVALYQVAKGQNLTVFDINRWARFERQAAEAAVWRAEHGIS